MSWQHFSPSTYVRSRCDKSSYIIRKDTFLPEISCRNEDKKKKSCSAVSSTEYQPLKGLPELRAEHYLKIRHIKEFFNFLMGHLICSEPKDPIEYLTEILNRCISYRDSHGEEPLLVTPKHLRSLYDAFDPFGKGAITPEQYKVAMENIGVAKGITPNNPNPPLNKEKKVTKEYFLAEAQRCLIRNLQKMLRIPKDWEENQLLCKNIMPRQLLRDKKTIPVSIGEYLLQEKESKSKLEPFKCEIVKSSLCPDASSYPSRMRHEPEQLFLNMCGNYIPKTSHFPDLIAKTWHENLESTLTMRHFDKQNSSTVLKL